MRSVSETAQGAIDALNKYGWIRYEGGSKDTGFCALGAINYATFCGLDNPNEEYDEFRICSDSLAKAIGTKQIALWNDDSSRTKDDVIAALQKVIDNERNNRD